MPLGLSLWREIGFEFSEADLDLRQLQSIARGLLPIDSAAEIGRAYLRDHTDESLGQDLVRSLRAGSHGVAGPRALSQAELRNHLARAVREDFQQRRIVLVGNWHLARTEARLCALVAAQI